MVVAAEVVIGVAVVIVIVIVIFIAIAIAIVIVVGGGGGVVVVVAEFQLGSISSARDDTNSAHSPWPVRISVSTKASTTCCMKDRLPSVSRCSSSHEE